MARDGQLCSKILVVEDDPDTREILAEFFSAHGYDVKAVATAEAGLEELKCHTADVVLSDNQLNGGHTGSWMLRRAYAEGLLRHVAAIMYTADEDPRVPRVVRVLRKPAALDEIEETTERAIDSARQHDHAPPISATQLTRDALDAIEEMAPSSRQA